jgi:hypothetical protein
MMRKKAKHYRNKIGFLMRDYFIEKKNRRDKYTERSIFRMSAMEIRKNKRKKVVFRSTVVVLMLLAVLYLFLEIKMRA